MVQLREIGSLHINESLSFTGGAEAYILSLAQAMNDRGIPVRLATGRQEELTYSNLTYFLPQVHKRTSLQIMESNLETIRKIMEDNELDIVHLHSIDSPVLYEKLANQFPTIRTIADSRPVCPTEFKINNTGNICTIPITEQCINCSGGRIGIQDLEKKYETLRAMTSLDLLITPSVYTKEQLILNGLPAEKIVALPLFIPSLPEFESMDPRYSSDVLFMGRITESKGLRVALKASAQIHDSFKFVICGDGQDLKNCQVIATQLGIASKVEFKGWVRSDERAKYFANTKVVIFPSMGPESFGLVGLEAMYYRKPVVGFNSGGVSEWLRNGQNGFLLQPGDIDGLAYYISYLLKNDDLREILGDTGKQILNSEFSVDVHIKTLIDIYNRVKSAKSRRNSLLPSNP